MDLKRNSCLDFKSYVFAKGPWHSVNIMVRAIFNWVSKVIRDCIGFTLLRSVIGLEISRHFFDQSDAKLKPIATWSLAFSRALRRLLVFALSSHWLLGIFPLFWLHGCCDNFGFGFTTLNRKALYSWLNYFHCKMELALSTKLHRFHKDVRYPQFQIESLKSGHHIYRYITQLIL